MNYDKQPINIAEQLYLLQSRGLMVEDIAIAKLQLRNCCAHHARIWNRRFALKPKIPNRLPLNWITPVQKPIKLYHQLCTLLYLEQSITPCMDLKSSLFKLFKEYPNIDLHAMGFPASWQEEALWQ